MQDGANSPQARILCLTHYRQKLKPELIIAAIDKLTDGAHNKVRGGHRCRRSTSFNLLDEILIKRCEHGHSYVGPMQIHDKLAEYQGRGPFGVVIDMSRSLMIAARN